MSESKLLKIATKSLMSKYKVVSELYHRSVGQAKIWMTCWFVIFSITTLCDCFIRGYQFNKLYAA